MDTRKVFSLIGAGGKHSTHEREKYDFYSSPEIAVVQLLKHEGEHFKNSRVWECACGMGHISKILERECHNIKLYSSDLIDRGYGETGIDFLNNDISDYDIIITNPPYKHALEFCKTALNKVNDNGRVYMLLRTLFLEGQTRYDELFKENPPKHIYVFSNRIGCSKDGTPANETKAQSFSWFVWEKGYKGTPEIRWLKW